jgi:hypothetical protein
MKKGAVISECEKYRYALWRVWRKDKLKVMFVMLNPSTADSNKDDPTIRRCIDFAKSWGYGGIVIGNLFGLRATDPKELLNTDDPKGLHNDYWLRMLPELADQIICAWGNDGNLNNADKQFR